MRRRYRFGPSTPAIASLATAIMLGAGPALAQEATAGATPAASPLACTAGSIGLGDAYFPTLGNGGYDVQHYDLDLDLDGDAGAISDGRATITALATLPRLCAFNLDFEGLTVDAITVDGQPAIYSRRGQELTIVPAAPLTAGTEFAVVVDYAGTPSGLAVGSDGQPLPTTPTPSDAVAEAAVEEEDNAGQQFGSGWWTTPDSIFVAGEPAGAETWYPVNGHPADKASYTFRLTVADPYRAAANGVLVETIDENGATTDVWEARAPMASYLATIHAGEIEIEEGVGPGGLPIRNVFAASIPEAERDIFDRFPEMIAVLEGYFGPYPFEVAGNSVVGVPLDFALETQTLSTFGATGLPPGVPLPPELRAQVEQVVVHELAHQWYGDAVSPLSWSDTWLNEGFATYSQSLWLEATEGPAARDAQLEGIYRGLETANRYQDPATLATLSAADLLTDVETTFGSAPDEFRQGFAEALGVSDAAGLADVSAERGLEQLALQGLPPAFFPGDAVTTSDPGPDALFSVSAIYQRGALTLHALRQEVGDETFFAILRTWPERYGGGNAITADFVALSEELAGRQLDPLFDAWLNQLALPPLSFETGTAEAGASPVASPVAASPVATPVAG